MKNTRGYKTIFAILFLSICLFGCKTENNLPNNIEDDTENNDVILQKDDTNHLENNNDESNGYVNVQENGCDDVDNRIEKIEGINNEEFELIANQVIKLSDGEEIEKVEWVEKDVCLRIAIQRTVEIDSEYRHLADYIFVKNDIISFFRIDYPSFSDSVDSDRYVFAACDFETRYEDVTFDDNKDILIFLGHQGSRGTMYYCAYVYSEGEYIYTKSFEDIPNYYVNTKEKCIEGRYMDKVFKYSYSGGSFKKIP